MTRCLLVLLAIAILAAPARARPTQEEVLQSISDNVGRSVEPGRFGAALAAGAGLIVLIAALSKWKPVARDRRKPLNHQGKLLKEVTKKVHLKPADLKRLRQLAEGKELSSPLVLLLCPSVLAKAMRDRPATPRKRSLLRR